MAVKTIYNSDTIRLKSETLLSKAKELCYSNEDPSHVIVVIELKKAKAEKLNWLCAQMDEKLRLSIAPLIQKAQNKLALAEEVNKYLREESEAIDPRVAKIMAKITQGIDISKTQGQVASDQLFMWQKRLNDLSTRLQCNPKTEEALAKMNKKLRLSEEVNIYVREKSEAIDPRVAKIVDKITQTVDTLKTKDRHVAFDQLFMWQKRLNYFSTYLQCNPKTKEALAKAGKTISDSDMEFLRKSPQFIDLGAVAKYKSDGLGNGRTMRSVGFALNYISVFTRSTDDRRVRAFAKETIYFNYHITWLTPPQEDSIRYRMTDLIEEKKPEWRISEDDAMQTMRNYPLARVSLVAVSHPEASLSKSPNLKEYSRDASKEEIQVRLEALLELKRLLNLERLGASVGIGHVTVALVFHSTGRISLYNHCGDDERPFYYEANFGSVEQAAEFLQKLTHKYNNIPPVTLKPYCDENTFKFAQMEKTKI